MSLAVIGVIGAFVWLGLAAAATNRHADGYPRTTVPGTITLSVSEVRTYYVYLEGIAGTVRDLDLTVTDPNGQGVAVSPMSSRSYYDHHGMFAHAVARFRAAESGTYRLMASGHLDPGGDFAVGDNAANRMVPNEWGVRALLVLTLGSALVLLATTFLGRHPMRRPSREQPDATDTSSPGDR